MATDSQNRASQKRQLQEILLVKLDISAKGIVSRQLEEYLNRLEAEMEQEDVAYVQKKVSALGYEEK